MVIQKVSFLWLLIPLCETNSTLSMQWAHSTSASSIGGFFFLIGFKGFDSTPSAVSAESQFKQQEQETMLCSQHTKNCCDPCWRTMISLLTGLRAWTFIYMWLMREVMFPVGNLGHMSHSKMWFRLEMKVRPDNVQIYPYLHGNVNQTHCEFQHWWQGLLHIPTQRYL